MNTFIKALKFIVFHLVRLGRNVAHFFFRAFATISFILAALTFFDTFLPYGFGTWTGWALVAASFVFSLLPDLYDKLLIRLIPEGQTIYL
ncbi:MULTISPECIES: hypothetical protein [Methylophaga]|jgi:hypothetical protein|uniref:hypothetical protein n=1 Tax=Methylophaga TaxID=40222 RepID=UPI000CDCA6B8|nr:hypothetical protein [Methylophaga nitratireducenticrescens]AUZ86150.1 hypothetical protein CDW43_15985 [Methylophaga nitratireducenticrescens]